VISHTNISLTYDAYAPSVSPGPINRDIILKNQLKEAKKQKQMKESINYLSQVL